MNRRSAEITAAVMGEGTTPIEYMLSVLRDPNAEPSARAWAAEKSAPYLHPRPSPIDRVVTITLPETSSIEGVEKAIDSVIVHMAAGKITPSEGHHFISVIETRRKAIETGDMAERLRRLEEKAEGILHE